MKKFLVLVTIAIVLLMSGVVTFAFENPDGGQTSDFQATVARYFQAAKSKTLEYAAPVAEVFGVNVGEGKFSVEDSSVTKHLEEAASTLDSAMKSLKQ